MNRDLASGPIVWLGIIVVTCLLLVLFQTVLWLVMPVLVAVVAYYLLSPLVSMAMARGLSRSRAVFIVTVLLSIFLAAVGLIVYPKISAAATNWRDKVGDYVESGAKLVVAAQATLSRLTPFVHHPPPLPETTPDKTGASKGRKGKNAPVVAPEVKPAVPEEVKPDEAANALEEFGRHCQGASPVGAVAAAGPLHDLFFPARRAAFQTVPRPGDPECFF